MNEEQIENFLSRIRDGISLQAACRLNGISMVAMYAALERGAIEEERLALNPKMKPRKSEEGCLDLWIDYNKAEGEFQAKLELSIYKQGLEDWKALQKILENRYPGQYGPASVKRGLKEIEAQDQYEIEEG